MHTEVFDAFEGQGVGGALARGVLDDLQAREIKVRPFCPFIAGWIRRHPDYLDGVADAYRNRVVPS
jgi:predicted GNAT family acetyltransferase